nr:sensor histidine kinase [uncultured Flavobacterium sp.]
MDFFKRIWEYIESNRILKHVLFWLGYTLINISVGLNTEDETLAETLVFLIILLIPQALATYILAYFIIAKIFFKKKYVLAFFCFFFTVYFFSALARLTVVYVGEPLFRVPPFEQESFFEIFTDLRKLWVHYIPAVFMVSFMFLFVKFFLEYKRKKEEETQLLKENAEVELKALKAQLNPHFLFNTLNNIYSLSLDNSPRTPVAIGKLADILDHILYKCNDQFVNVNTEIELLKNYIELEKLRYDDRLQISFGSNIEKDIQIPPLLLLSLVENAFKHGAGEDSGSPKIDIDIYQKDKIFKFEISNSVSNTFVITDKVKIGLSNITKQLDLIYANNYQLDIQQTAKAFTVVLQINLQY